jgi:hypothetical protein
MNLSRTSQRPGSCTPLVDAAMDAYLTWREESAAVATAYQNWGGSSRAERAAAFDSYVVALDYEERAAGAYRELIEQAAAAQRVRAIPA